MIVFVDMKMRRVNLYTDKGLEKFAFDEVTDLPEFIGKNKVLYVTGAVEASAEDIISLIASVAPEDVGSDDDGQYFLRSKAKSVLHIEDIGITFNGPGDCKPVDEDLYELCESSFQLKQMIKIGKVEIINQRQMRKAVRECQKDIKRKDRLMKKKEEIELDSIIVNDNIRAEDVAGMMFSNDNDNDTFALDVPQEGEEIKEKTYSESDIRNGLIS